MSPRKGWHSPWHHPQHWGRGAAQGQACAFPACPLPAQAGLAQDTTKGAHTARREQEGGLELLWDHSKEGGQQKDSSRLGMERVFPKLLPTSKSWGRGQTPLWEPFSRF